MPSLFHAAILATVASAADMTTSIWLPGAANANQSFVGSVVEQNGDQTVLSLAFANPVSTPDYFTSAPAQVTVGGTTYVAYNVSATDYEDSSAVAAVTIELECRRSDGGISAVPTCTLSTLGANSVLGAVCSGLSSPLPDYCTASSAVNVEQTQTFSGESQYYINNYQLIITAGTEKLGAAAAATPSAGGASVTGAGASAGTSGGSAPSQSGSGASVSPAQATGAAPPMRTMAPALVGLGAAAGAFFL